MEHTTDQVADPSNQGSAWNSRTASVGLVADDLAATHTATAGVESDVPAVAAGTAAGCVDTVGLELQAAVGRSNCSAAAERHTRFADIRTATVQFAGGLQDEGGEKLD